MDMGKNENGHSKLLNILLIIAIVFHCFLLWNYIDDNNSQKTQQKTSSVLIDSKEIAVLSVSEFVYNGIAQSLNDNGEPDYNILYNSIVKISVDANTIDFAVDDEQKKVTFYFPDFIFEDPLIDPDSISLIPSKKDLYIDDVIKLCRSDALAEAKASAKLLTIAQENLKSIVKAWYAPVLEDYTFEYNFGSAKGGESK